MLYDINNICFLKINSFICKTFKVLHEEGLLKKLQNIFLEDLKTCEDFLTTFFYLVSLLLISKDKKGEEYYSQMARSRKGFYFDLFKINFEKYFGYPQCKIMIEFMDILQIQFRKSCDDKDVLKLEEVNDNSIDLENREQCAICLEYTEEKDVHLNPCNHCFHMKCVKDMVSNNTKKCPLCKRVILGVKEDPSFVISSTNERRSLFSNSEYDSHVARNLFLFRDNSSSQRSNNQSPSIFGNAFLFQDNERNNQNNSRTINNIKIDLTKGNYTRQTFNNRHVKDNNSFTNPSYNDNKLQKIHLYNNNTYQRRNNDNTDNKSISNYSIKTDINIRNYNNNEDSLSVHSRPRRESNITNGDASFRKNSKGGRTTVIQYYSGQRRKYENYDNNTYDINKNKK
jgi:hypothetical protein